LGLTVGRRQSLRNLKWPISWNVYSAGTGMEKHHLTDLEFVFCHCAALDGKSSDDSGTAASLAAQRYGNTEWLLVGMAIQLLG
jgi:hypothetical protein